MENTPIPLAVGLSETGPEGRVPMGHYDQGLNMRDFDERGQRQRPAARCGLVRFGKTDPCPASSAVRHSFTAKDPLSRYEFADLDTTPDSTLTPDAVAEQWSSSLTAKPVAAAVSPSGVAVALLSTGAVVEINDTGRVRERFSVGVPVAFELIPSIAVDELEGVWVGARYTQQVDGAASRLWRWTRNDTDDWEQSTQQDVSGTVEEFWYDAGDLFAFQAKPEGSDFPFDHALSRFTGATILPLVEMWTRPAPDPVVAAAFRESSCYFVAAPNRGRTAPAGGSASVDWTPAEIDDYRERLFSWHSALREQNIRGLQPGDTMPDWQTAKNDDWIDPPLYDQTQRRYVAISGYDVPSFEQDPNGNGPEVRFANLDLTDTTPTWFYTGQNQTNVEKQNAQEICSWQRASAPMMEDASSDGHAFGLVIVARIVNYEGDGGASPAFTDKKLLWHQGDLRLYYEGDAGNTQATLTLEQGGSSPTTSGAGDTVTLTDGEAYVCVSIVCNGFGVASAAYWRVNGVKVGGTGFTMDRPTQIGARANIGWSFTYSGTPGSTIYRFRGAYKEIIGVLGTNGTGVHDVAPVEIGEVDKLEGYAMNAYGIQNELDVGHNYNNSPPVGAGGSTPPLDFEDAFQEPAGLLFKLDRATGDLRWVYSGDDAGAGVAVDLQDGAEAIYTAGTPLDLDAVSPARIGRVNDLGDTVSLPVWQNTAGAVGSETTWEGARCRLFVDGCGQLYVPFTSTGSVVATELQHLNEDTGAATWTLSVPDGPSFLGPGGLFVDDRFKNGACGPEFLYVLCRNGSTAKRVSVVGQRDTGETRAQETEVIAICASGAVARLETPNEVWTPIVSDFDPGLGERPWSFELFGRHFFGGPDDYRVWLPREKQLREWTPGPGSVIPRQIFTAQRWRGRVLAASQSDRHILYGSAYGDAFDWNTGGEIVSATQAFAGTTAAAGAIPDPITAIMIAPDDIAYIGTSRSVWRLTGDPQTGGQLDDVLATQGVHGPYAWCRGSVGELYWVSSARSVVQMGAAGLVDISSQWIRGRLQKIDPDEYRMELAYSDRERGVYLTIIPKSGTPETGIEHLFWSQRTGKWHPTGYSGGIGRALSSASVLESADAGGWGALIGFADGALRYAHPEAQDDDGEPIPFRMRLSLAGDDAAERVLCTRAQIVLAHDQGPMRVRGVAGRTGGTGDDYGQETTIMPGRGDSANVQLAGSNLWLEMIGSGAPSAIESMRVDLYDWTAN